jgi:hypothetical protein
MKEKHYQILIAVALILIGASLRLLPHSANFAPVAAIAIFGGAVLPRKLAIWVPLAVMVASDVFIGFYNIMPIIWACYVVIAIASSYILRKPKLLKGIALTLSSSLFFFVVTNFAVWMFGGMYAHTLSGLSYCYTMALPFFRNTALSDMLYTVALFGLYALAMKAARRYLLPVKA